jgi:hypothetical protein
LAAHPASVPSSDVQYCLIRFHSLVSDWEHALSVMASSPRLSHPKEHTHTLPAGPSEPPGHSFAKEAAQERVLHFIRDAYQVVNPHYQGSFSAHQQKI